MVRAVTGLSDNAPVPTGFYEPEDYFRYSAPGVRAITTSPTAIVYFSYDGGKTNVAQFNQAFSALNDSDLDRNDWIYGDSGCPAANPHIQDAISCSNQAEPVGLQPGSPGVEVIVLRKAPRRYDSGPSALTPQTITFYLGIGLSFGNPPFSITASASSGLPVTFASTTPGVCTVSGSTVTITGVGACSITASQAAIARFTRPHR